MSINEEKKFLYSILENITEERKKLTNAYLDIVNKITELEKESRSYREQSETKDAVEKVQNIEFKKEAKTPSIMIEEIVEAEPVEVTKKEDVRTLAEIIEEHNRMRGESDDKPDELSESKIPKEEIEREKDKLPRKSPYLNIDKVNGLISQILKEKGSPMHVKEIFAKLNSMLDNDVNIQNLRNNILPRVCKSNPKIERALRGYYQYNYNG